MTIEEMRATLWQIIKQNEPIAKVDMEVIKEMHLATYHIQDELIEAREAKTEAREEKSFDSQMDAYKGLLEERTRISEELDTWLEAHSSNKDTLILLTKAEHDQYKNIIPPINSNYWLRDATTDPYRVWLDNGNSCCSSMYSLRPVLHTTPADARFFNDFLMNWRNINWYKLDENFWISLESWGRIDFDPETSNYEVSAIRKYLYDWYVDND